MAEPMTGERLDALVDTDPIKLRDEALALLQRAEQAEAEVREVKAALASHGQRDYWKRLALAREQTYDKLRDALGDAGQQVEEAQAALGLAEVEAEAQKDRADGAVRAHDLVAGALADMGKQLTQVEGDRDRLAEQVKRLEELIESYPPGSRFAQSGAQALFRRMLHGKEAPDA